MQFPKPSKTSRADKSGLAFAKDHPVRSESYRRLVAMLPCANCGISELSQAAHPPPTGKGIKEDDRECFPLCCDRPGERGCHSLFDQYKLFTPETTRCYAKWWGAETREIIDGNGMWPADLPRLETT